MDYVKQRRILRSQRVIFDNYGPTWDFSDLDGGCDVWRRYRERRLEPSRLIPRSKKASRKVAEQFQETLEKDVMARSMWNQRANDNADRGDWWLQARPIDNSRSEVMEADDDDKDEYSVGFNSFGEEQGKMLNVEMGKNISAAKDDAEDTVGWRLWSDERYGKNENVVDNNNDGDDKDEDEDEFSTIYSCARRDPLASLQVVSSNSPPASTTASTSTTGIDSHITTPSTKESMTLVYESFDWANDVEDAEGTLKLAGLAQSALELVVENDSANQLAFKEFLTRYVYQAWMQYEAERQIEIVERNRTLHVKRLQGDTLPICAWKLLPLSDTYADFEKYALLRPEKGECAYDRTPVIVITNEDGQHFRLLDVKKILTNERIAEFRAERDLEQKRLQKAADSYNLWNMAGLEGQKAAERRAVDAAKAYWLAEQKKRDATYIDWEHAEAQEVELLKSQIKEEVDLSFNSKERSEAKWKMRDYAKEAKAARIQHYAKLKLKLLIDELDDMGSGCYVGSEYDLNFDSRLLKTFLKYRDEIDAMVYAISTNDMTAEAKAEAKREREELLRQQLTLTAKAKMSRVVLRRENEILAR